MIIARTDDEKSKLITELSKNDCHITSVRFENINYLELDLIVDSIVQNTSLTKVEFSINRDNGFFGQVSRRFINTQFQLIDSIVHRNRLNLESLAHRLVF